MLHGTLWKGDSLKGWKWQNMRRAPVLCARLSEMCKPGKAQRGGAVCAWPQGGREGGAWAVC